MSKNLIDAKIFVIALLTALAAAADSTIAIAKDTHYQHFSLKENISVEVPSHWLVHTDSEKKNFAAAAEAAARTAGIDYDNNKDKSRLLAISALPTPSGAKVRINLIRPLPFSSAELRSVSAQELKEFKAEMTESFQSAVAAMGVKLLDVATPSIEMINGSPALLLEYRRSDPSGPSPWTIKQYMIPTGDKMIELTISCRESDASIWKPILEYVKQSLRF